MMRATTDLPFRVGRTGAIGSLMPGDLLESVPRGKAVKSLAQITGALRDLRDPLGLAPDALGAGSAEERFLKH